MRTSLLTFLALIGFIMVGTSPANAAAKPDKGPTAAELDKANKKAELNTENTATRKLPADQGEVKFTPAKIGDMNDADRAKGVIIGKLVTPHKTPEGLEAGTYRAYLCKEGKDWCVYYIQDTKVIKQVTCVHIDDNAHEPSFVDSGKMIRYWELQFGW